MAINGVGHNYDYFGTTTNYIRGKATVREAISKTVEQSANLSISDAGRNMLREMASKFEPDSDYTNVRELTIQNTNEVAWEHYTARDVSMAVTGVNNYSNIYTNAYTGNIRKNNAKETTEKQVVEQTEDVKTGTTRKTAADELSYLSKKFDNYSFVSANYSPGMKYGKSTTTNVAISPQFLTKMVNDSDLEDEYIKEIGNMKKLDEQFAKQQADIGWRVEQGWAIDKDGNISSWAIGHKDSKVKSFLQNMSEKAEEILQKQLEKAKDTKEVFSMKKHKEVIKKNKVDLKV